MLAGEGIPLLGEKKRADRGARGMIIRSETFITLINSAKAIAESEWALLFCLFVVAFAVAALLLG